MAELNLGHLGTILNGVKLGLEVNPDIAQNIYPTGELFLMMVVRVLFVGNVDK